MQSAFLSKWLEWSFLVYKALMGPNCMVKQYTMKCKHLSALLFLWEGNLCPCPHCSDEQRKHQQSILSDSAQHTAHLHCPRTSKRNQPMRSQQRFANLWMRKANLWLHSAGFIPATSFPFFAFVGKILGMQPESSEPIGFLQSCRFSPCSTYWTRFFFF